MIRDNIKIFTLIAVVLCYFGVLSQKSMAIAANCLSNISQDIGKFSSLFEKPEGAGIESPLVGKEDDYASLEKITEVQKFLDEAKKAHNLKQSLPNYKKSFISYNEMVAYRDKTIEHLKISEKCIQNYIGGYFDSAASSWMGSSCGYKNDKMYCHYSPEKNASDATESIGSYDILCPDNASYKCYVPITNNFKDRSGISGYLLALYNQAKIDSTQNDDENNDLYISSLDNEDTKTLSKSELDKKGKEGQNEDAMSNLKKPSMEDDMKAEARVNELLNWTIGAEVSKELSNDLRSGTSKFGGGSKRFPLWNDQINFYDQYVDGKYNNIKDYIQNEPLLNLLLDTSDSVNNVFPYQDVVNEEGIVTLSATQQRISAATSIGTLRSAAADGKNTSDEIEQMLEDERLKLSALTLKYKKDLENLNNKKALLYSSLDKNSTKLSDLRDEYNNNLSIIKNADSNTLRSNDALNKNKKFSRNGLVSPFENKLAEDNSENAKNRANALLEKDRLKIQIASLEKKVKDQQKELEDIKQNIEDVRIKYVKNYSDLEKEYKIKVDTTIANRNNTDLAKKIAKATITVSPLAQASKILQCVRDYASKQVDDAIKEIEVLKQDKSIYYPENVSKLHEIHKNMIDKITHIGLEDLSSCSLLMELSQKVIPSVPEDQQNEPREIGAGEQNIMDILSIFANICTDGICETPDTEYFVGIVGKPRDFMAPMSPVDFASAPLREIFHFDITDYNSVVKYYSNKDKIHDNKNVTIIGESFTELDIPEIWKYILKHRAYVEKDIDYADFLNKGSPKNNLVRSGIYPCQSNGNTVDRGALSYTINDTPDKESYGTLAKCNDVDVKAKGGRIGIYDKEARAQTSAGGDLQLSGDVSKSSELGTLLDYVDGKLTFRQELQSALDYINKTEEVEGNYKYYAFNRYFLDRNQFGDYLNQFELEQIAEEAILNMEPQIEEVRKSLNEIFEVFGAELSADFDLTKIDDYNLAVKYLEDYKEKNLQEAKNRIDLIAVTTDNLINKKSKLSHQVKLFEKDSDEAVFLNGDDDLDELEEKIKTSNADAAITNEYQEAGSEEFAKKLEELKAPYCAAYPINN